MTSWVIGSETNRLQITRPEFNSDWWEATAPDTYRKKDVSTSDKIKRFLDTSYGGPFRSTQILAKLCEMGARFGGTGGEVVSDFRKALTPVWTTTVIWCLPSALSDAKEAVFKPTASRNYINITKKIATAVSTVANTGRFVIGAIKVAKVAKVLGPMSGPVGQIADAADVVSSVCEAKTTFSGYLGEDGLSSLNQRIGRENGVAQFMKDHVRDSTRLCQWKMAKIVAGIAGTVFGCSAVGLLVGGLGLSAIIPLALISATCSLFSAVMAFKIGVHEIGMYYKPFDPSKHVAKAPDSSDTEMKEVSSEPNPSTEEVSGSGEPRTISPDDGFVRVQLEEKAS